MMNCFSTDVHSGAVWHINSTTPVLCSITHETSFSISFYNTIPYGMIIRKKSEEVVALVLRFDGVQW